MLFENQISFLILKVLIVYLGTMGMIFSTEDFRSVKNKTAGVLIFLTYTVYTGLSSYIIIHFLDYEAFLWLFIATISVPIIFLLRFISDEPFAKHLFTHATHILTSLYITAGITLLNTALQGTMLSDLLFRLLAYLLVILLNTFIIRRVYLGFIGRIQNGWGILAMIPCALLILALTLAFYPVHYTKRPASVILLLLLGAVIVIIYFAICCYLWLQYHQLDAEQNREILELQVKNIREQTADIEKIAEQTKILRHDIRHMLSTIASLAEKGDAQAILDYVNAAAAMDEVPEPARYCADPILDATLSGYLERAKNSGIALETMLRIPESLPVDSAELSICFANALEASIKACESLPQQHKRIIVKCVCQPNLMFEIIYPYKGRNTLSTNISLKICTRSVQAFCQRHNALCSFTAEGGWFRIAVTM